jgi:hypothetical protein
MPNVTNEMKNKIISLLDDRFDLPHKFMRVAGMAAREGVWVYNKGLKLLRQKRNRLRIINRLRKRALFIIRTHQLVQHTLTRQNKREYKKTLKMIRGIDFVGFSHARLLELDSNLYLHCMNFVKNL